MYRLAVFDLDGTLLNTLDDLAAACNYALQSEGYPVHPHEAYKLFVGGGAYNLIKRILPSESNNAAVIEKVTAVFSAYYSDHAQDYTKPYPGVLEMLERIRAAGIAVAVLSNKPDRYTGVLVKEYFPGLVDIAYGQREGVPIKPDPTALFEIMKYCGCEKRDCVYIGDSGIDMQTGNSAGVYTIGVSWGFRTKEELEKDGAMLIVDKTSQLGDFIVDNLKM